MINVLGSDGKLEAYTGHFLVYIEYISVRLVTVAVAQMDLGIHVYKLYLIHPLLVDRL